MNLFKTKIVLKNSKAVSFFPGRQKVATTLPSLNTKLNLTIQI